MRVAGPGRWLPSCGSQRQGLLRVTQSPQNTANTLQNHPQAHWKTYNRLYVEMAKQQITKAKVLLSERIKETFLH